MSRLIGGTKSWLWWVAGTLCALAFNAAARAGEIAAKYGIPVRPPIDNPAVTPEQQAQAEKLVADYFAPVAATDPTAEQKATAEKLIKDFASDDFKAREAASVEIVKVGPAALGQLREAAKSTDVEVATRSGAAIVAIETAARQGIVEELKKIQGSAASIIQKQLGEARNGQAKLYQAVEAARKKGDQDEAARLQAEIDSAGTKMAALSALLAQVMPMTGIQMKYGVQALYGIRAVE